MELSCAEAGDIRTPGGAEKLSDVVKCQDH